MVDDLEKLRAHLRDMPVPEPRPGFVDRVLADATTGKSLPKVHEVRAAFARPATWWAAAAGAVAATLAWMVFWVQFGAPAEPRVVLALNESRDVSLVIDSERDLEGATIHIYVTGSVALNGYGEQHEIEWLTSLTQGANLLSLPVIGVEPGEGRVEAVIEHEGRTRRVSVAMHVSARGDTA
jgi:hypothetical protein